MIVIPLLCMRITLYHQQIIKNILISSIQILSTLTLYNESYISFTKNINNNGDKGSSCFTPLKLSQQSE